MTLSRRNLMAGAAALSTVAVMPATVGATVLDEHAALQDTIRPWGRMRVSRWDDDTWRVILTEPRDDAHFWAEGFEIDASLWDRIEERVLADAVAHGVRIG